jgi:MinD-like ATPase involved in chromosome partitioning or flagellar assembly
VSALDVWSVPDGVPAPTAGRGRVVLVCGGRQGVGVSTIAELLALVEEGSVLLAETDGRPGSLARRVQQLRGHYALTVVDGGSRLATALEVAEAGIDQLLCVTAPDEVSGAGAYAMIKAVGGRVAGLPVGVVVNRAPFWAATEVDQYLRQAAGHFLRREIELVRQVPLDECLRAGMRAGMPLHEAAAGSPAALALHEVAQGLHWKQDRLSPSVFSPRPLHRRS